MKNKLLKKRKNCLKSTRPNKELAVNKKVTEYGSEFDWDSSSFYMEDDIESHYIKSKVAYRFRSGRDALKAVAQQYKKTHNTVLLPALCCESMVTPFSMNGYHVAFYKLKEDLTADEDDIKAKMSDTALMVYISYFGIDPLSAISLEALKEGYPNAKFIEDRTHTPLENNTNREFVPDAMVISIRKWLAIADGGLVFSNDKFEKNIPADCYFSDLRKEAMKKKSEFLQSGDEKLKEHFRMLLGEAGDLLDVSPNPYGMTEVSAEQLLKIDYNGIFEQRVKNVQTLKEGLYPFVDCGKLKFITSSPEKSTLYFPVVVKNRDSVQKSLAEKAVFCPVIWPIPEQAKNICANSEYVAENMLAIPCDQRYKREDMLKIIEIIKTVI